MADPNFSWIYLVIFLAIPLARIMPRLLARYGGGGRSSPSNSHKRHFVEFGQLKSDPPFAKKGLPDHLTEEQQILGEMHHGANTFEKIRKNTGLDANTLDSVLCEMEKNGLMKVVKRQGMFGTKVMLYPTDKGFKEFYS